MHTPAVVKLQAYFNFPQQLSQGRAYNLKKVAESHASEFATRFCRGTGISLLNEGTYNFTMDLRSCRGLWEHAPPENF